MQEETLGIIKPDAVKKNVIGRIIQQIEDSGLSVVAIKMLQLTKKQAQDFYYVHQDRVFFQSLTEFMSEGPIVVMVLRGEQAIRRWREIMGATDPAQAGEGTIRRLFGENVEVNSVHGSDSSESARFEIDYFFDAAEWVTYPL